MATQVPPSTKLTPEQYRPLPPAAELYEPEDYKEAFSVHKVGSSTMLTLTHAVTQEH